MITSLRICNFQTHKRLELDFEPGVNCIVGPSDVGKSSVVRALGWVVFNRPLGEAFVRDGAKSCSVEVKTDTVTVKRVRSSKRNAYVVDGTELVATKGDVPEQVSLALQLSPVNFQNQHDGPFWFCTTAGDVSRQLNAIVDLATMDDLLARLAARLRTARVVMGVARERVAAVRKRRGELAYVPAMAGQLTQIRDLYKKQSKTTKLRSELATAVEGVVRCRTGGKQLAIAVKRGGTTVLVGDAYADVAAKRAKLACLIAAIRQRKIEANTIVPNIDGLFDLVRPLADVFSRRRSLSELLTIARELKSKSEGLSTEAKEATAELQKRIGVICPLCGSKISR